MRPRSILPVLLLFVALLADDGCSPNSTRSSAGPSDPAPSADPSADPSEITADPSETAGPAVKPASTESPDELRAAAEAKLTAECRSLLDRIRGLDEGIPRLFLDLKRKAADINRDMVDCASECKSFLESCGGTALDCEIEGVFGRVLLGRYDRYSQELGAQKRPPDALSAQLAEYREWIRALGESAADCSSIEPSQKAEALRVLVEVSKRERDFPELRAKADRLLAEFPDFDLRSHVVFTRGRSYVMEGDYKGAVEYLREVIAERSEEEEYIMYNIVLFEGLSGSGNLEGVQDLMESILVEYPDRVRTVSKNYFRGQYEQWLHMAKFWIGFSRYSLGDLKGARVAFEEHKAEAESLRAELAQQGKKLDPVVEITLEYRTKDLLLFMDEFQGKVPEVDMDFGSYWATDETLSLGEARGNVVIVVFRRPGDRRSASFLQAAAGLVGEFEEQGVKAATVAFLLGNPDEAAEEQKMQKMRDELDELGVRLPGGFDPDRKKQAFFRATHGTVGTASCVVFNRDGEMAYFMADPRDMDRQILRRVVERLLEE